MAKKMRTCTYCGGDGVALDFVGNIPIQQTCPRCGGTGVIEENDEKKDEKKETKPSSLDTPNNNTAAWDNDTNIFNIDI